MIKAIIIDDETNAIKTLETLIDRHCSHIQVMGTCQNITDGKTLIEKIKPDLLFLDIAMPGGSGFNLLEQIKNIDFKIVFVTAFNEFALKAFDFSALHYILKPIDHNSLIEVEQRYLKNSVDKTDLTSIKTLNHNLTHNDKKLVLSTVDKTNIINIEDLLYIESDSNYSMFICSSGNRIIVSKQINYYEKLLDETQFYRIHHKFLVNMKHINKYLRGRGGQVLMSNGQKLDVSVRKKPAFIEALKDYSK